MNDTSIVITDAQVLSLYSPLEVKQIDGLGCHSFFLTRTQRAFDELLQNNPNTDHRPYQYYYAAVMCCRRYNIMGWAMGVGKTISSILTLYALYCEKLSTLRPGCIHITVPNILAAERWLQDLGKFPSFAGLYKVVRKEKDLLQVTTPIIIYAHDLPKRQARTTTGCLSRRLRRFKPVMLIVDEVHGLRMNTTRTKHLLTIRKKSRRCLALTGTPSEANLKEIHNILSFVYGERWSYKTSQKFSKDYGIQQRIATNYLYGSGATSTSPEKYLQRLDPSRIPSYYHLMRRYIHRVRIDEPQVRDCMTLPEPEFLLQTVTPSEAQLEEYNRYIQEHYRSLQRIAQGIESRQTAEALRLIHPLIKIANFPDLRRPTPKIEKLLEIVRQAKGKIVVFCDRVDSAWLCKHYLIEAGINTIRIYAEDSRESPPSLNEDQRIETLSRFQYDSSVQAGIFSINIAQQSIDITNASDVVYYCLPWSSIKLQQSISRVVRSGNPHPNVVLHFLHHRGLIDEYQVLLALEKVKAAKLMLDYEMGEEENYHDYDITPSSVINKLFEEH